MIDIFTRQEKLSIIFILLGIIIGAGIEFYKSHRKPILHETKVKRLDEIELEFRKHAAEIDSFVEQQQRSQFLSSSIRQTKQDSSLLLIDINTASVDELIKLPNIGPVIAMRIIEYRDRHGPFQNIEELTKVRGIGPKKIISVKPYIQMGKR